MRIKPYQSAWEVAYNHYHNRRGKELPKTRKIIMNNRPDGTRVSHAAWQTLTHGDLPRDITIFPTSTHRPLHPGIYSLPQKQFGKYIHLNSPQYPALVKIFTLQGKLLHQQTISSPVRWHNPETGIVLISIQ